MKKRSRSRFRFTESKMADAFMEILQSSEGLPGIGPFDMVYREISCRQGRPDFIALRYKNSPDAVPLPQANGLAGASILTLMKPKSPRTVEYIVHHSEFSKGTIKRSLRQLLASGHVERTENGLYRLGKAGARMNTEIWVFELKLDNPKRAIFQAQQSRAFAERAFIVVPSGQEKNYQQYNETIKRWGIGLASFNPVTKEFSVVKRGRRARAFSRQHQIYTMAQLHSCTNSNLGQMR